MKTYLDDIETIPGLPICFPPGSIVAVDIELFHADKERLHRPTGEFASLACTADGKIVHFAFDLHDVIENFEAATKGCTLVFQKAFFDITQLRRWIPLRPRPIYDTLLIDRILWSGYFSNFSLADMSRRYLNLYMEKETRASFESATEMDEEKIRYAALDVAATWRILQKQLKIARPVDLEVWEKYDQPALWAILDFQGFPIAAEKWKVMAERNQEEATRLKHAFPFNPNSPKQILEWFQANSVKLKSTGEEVLSEVDHPMAGEILRYRKVNKRATTYGLKWLEKNVESDGRVYCEYDPSRAETSRMASDSPNMQQIPVRETKEFRECFVAPEGYVLVIADYSAQEPRVLAYLSQDEQLMKIFQDGKDPYIETALMVYHKKIEKKDPLRDKCKILFLAVAYGMTPFGLSMELGVTEQEARQDLDNFFSVFHGVQQWSFERLRNNEYVELATGRRVHLNPYNDQWMKNSRNTPVQGTSAEITKKALHLLHECWPKEFGPFGVVAVIHDEIVSLVPEQYKDQAQDFIKQMMESAANDITPGVPAKASVVCGKSWAEK